MPIIMNLLTIVIVNGLNQKDQLSGKNIPKIYMTFSQISNNLINGKSVVFQMNHQKIWHLGLVTKKSLEVKEFSEILIISEECQLLQELMKISLLIKKSKSHITSTKPVTLISGLSMMLLNSISMINSKLLIINF